MSIQEQQEEELEVLQSIYEGDQCFTQLNPTTFQYKIGEDGNYRSFLLEIKWSESYPASLPDINLDAFYNKGISPDVKGSIISKILSEAESLLDTAMTYTLFEWAKENADDLTENFTENVYESDLQAEAEESEDQQASAPKVKERKEQLTKAQKRKMYDRLDDKGERPRGYNWMDIVKHLSQSGSQSFKT